MLPTERSSIAQTAIPGGWAEERIEIGGHIFDILRPSQPLEFLEQLSDSEGAEEQDPYWAELWPTAQRMAAFVLDETWPRGTPTLELGCGVGLVGLAALKVGLDVTFSDIHDLAVRTGMENAKRNGYPSAPGRMLDWREATGARWPLILASDVLYEPQLHSPLIDTLDALLATDGACWIGDPLRSTTGSFIETAHERGYGIKILNAGSIRTSADDERFQLLRVTREASSQEQDSTSIIE